MFFSDYACFSNFAQWPHVMFTKQTFQSGNNSKTGAKFYPLFLLTSGPVHKLYLTHYKSVNYCCFC